MSDEDVFVSPAARRSAAIRVALLTLFLLGGILAVRVALPSVTDPEWIRAELAVLGWVAPFAFVAVQTLQVILAPLPGQLLAGVGGYLFGSLLGVALSMVGVVLGSTVVFLGSRRYGRPYVESVIAPSQVDRWDRFVDQTGVAGLFVLFLLPTFPDDLLCFVAGLSELRLGTFLVLLTVGRLPSFLLVGYAGMSVANGALVPTAVLLAGIGLLSIGVYLYRSRLVAALGASR